MPLVELPSVWIIGLNIAGWPIIHLGTAWVFTRLPQKCFAIEPKWARPRASEAKLYARFGKVRQWKRLLPDAAPWLRGFAKRRLQSADPEYFESFICETRRGEAAHWVMLFLGGLFLIWNPLWADVLMVVYAGAANLPCIITQRYNRLRFERVVRCSRAAKSQRKIAPGILY